MTPYTTLADVRAWLGIKENNTSDDELLTRMIKAASQWIDTYLDRSLALASYTKTFDGVGGLRQCLPFGPIVSVESVVVDGVASDGLRWRSDDYGVVLKGGWFQRGYGNVEISWTAGYAVIPEDVVQCCIDIVAFNYRRRERIGHASKTLNGETTAFVTSDVPPECKAVLQQYRRVIPV